MNLSLRQRWKKLMDDLRPMSFKQKLDHLLTYYYWVLIIVAVIVMLVCIVVSSVQTLNREVLVAGVLVNADVGLQGREFLEDSYLERLGGIEGDQEIQITNVVFEDPATTQNIEQTYNTSLRVVAMISAESVDYLIMDQIGLEFYLAQDIFLDLREILTPEQLELWKDDLIYMTYEETGETIPMAVNIRNTAFGKKYLTTEEAHYIGFAVNTPRKDACIAFWEYITEE